MLFHKVHGEAKDADVDAASKWKDDEMPQLLSDYDSSQIYNVDETGIYFRALPDSTNIKTSEKRTIRGYKNCERSHNCSCLLQSR